jgi:hypothetical protein
MSTLDQQWADLYAAGRVRWMPGMSYSGGDRVVSVDDDHVLWTQGDEAPQWEPAGADIIPDFTDPATIGCLLHQAREAWGDPGLTVVGEYCPPFDPAWRVTGQSHHGGTFQRLAMIGYTTEPAAILAAIAAAPPKVNP